MILHKSLNYDYPQVKNKYSMIFKTFNSDIDNISSKWGLFGKSFYDVSTDIEKRWNNVSQTLQSTNDYTLQNISNAWKMGNSNPIKFLADDEIISILDRYNKALDSGAEATARFLNSGTGNEFMDGFLKDLDGAPATMDKYKVATKNATVAQKSFSASTIATKTAVLALNVAVSMGLSIALSALIKTISEVSQSEENLKDTSRELGSELSSNVSAIEDYKEKINDLKSVLNDSSSSFDDVSQARTDLMVIQDELIKKFGTEKGVIEDITEAIYGQTDALDQLSKDAYYKAVDEFNKKTSGDKFVDWLTFGNADDNRVQSNMDKMIRQMESSVYSLETTGNEVLDNLIEKSLGLTISDDIYGDGKHFTIYGKLDEIQEKLTTIREMSSDFDVSTGFENSFTDISNDVNSLLEAHQNLYKQYVLWEKILTDNQNNQYDEQYNLINQAKKSYDEAMKSGDNETIQKASEEYSKTLSSAIDLAMSNYDYDVASYFGDMYPDMQQMFSEWKFTLDFEPNTDGLKDKVSNSLIGLEGFSSEDILTFNPNVATEDQIDAYGELNSVASEYGLTLKGLINLLMQMGLIQSESYQQLVDTFGQEAVDKLAPEDLEIAYSISSEEADKALEQEKNKIKSELESLSKEGNVDLTIRPVIDSSAMQSAGWDVEDGSIATTFTQGEFIWQGDEENGQYVYVHYTPILPDGTVLTPDELTDYLYGTLEGSQSVLDADNKGIVLKVDTDLNIPEGDIKKFTSGEGSTDAIDSLIQKTGEWDDKVHGVQEQYYDTGEGINYASNALDGLIEKHKQLENPDEMSNLSPTITSSISQIATQLEPQFAKLGEAYKAIFTDDGFTLDDVDNSMLEGLRKSFAEIEEEVGVAFDATKLNSFFDALTNGNSSAEQVQQAFNDLATAYFYSTDTLAQLNEETADSIAKQLEELGVVNAKEVVYDTLNAKTEALALQEQLLAAQSDAVSRGANFNVESFLNQAGASEIARTYLFQLITAEQVFNNQDLNTADKIAKLKELATAYGQTAIAARIANLEKANEDGHVPIDYDKELASLQNDINNAVNNVKIDFKGIDTSGASKAGGDAGDAYVEAFEEELADLQDLRDRGVIDEAEYLNRLRELYTRYFADRKEYLDEYNKYERQYLEGMKSLYDSALSGISKLLSNKIDAVQEEKDATISALEEERDARLEVIEAQKEQLQAEIDLIDEQIDAKQEIIDGIQDEIDKMREAADQRKRNLDLQRAQYELEKMQQQRTKLVNICQTL